ncbi:RNA polymerase sigma factor [Sunxiuqinia elliptica]|uniref:RNA polymerase sigma factor, sigma-70 family n=1 Tax=Sunxiuqinia elliptica TaxID=655355 RepID=A0A1I2KN80_9BACT|nr:RNA polymerase sigma factor [Sunxiuqinia elliptica]SFF67700.1 RNA polymerase sigma factor, sigma-70 family [Sunxiuqinia elliptica]
MSRLLWQRFKEGDDQALSSLFEKYANDLYSYGMKIANNEDLVKDCVQEVFIQLINKRQTLSISSQIHVFPFKILRNKLFEELRTINRKNAILYALKEQESEFEDNIESSLIDIEQKEAIQKRIESALNQLSKRQQEAIYLRYSEGLSYDEVAELMGLDKASARTLVYRALKTIRDILGDSFVLFFIQMKQFSFRFYCIE